MKTRKSIIVVLFVLLTAQIASAYYCPSTGRWLSRDPVGEPGFQILQAATQAPITAASRRWINRDATINPEKVNTTTAFLNAIGIKTQSSKASSDAVMSQNAANLYVFVGNDPIVAIDGLGLFPPCFNLPLPDTCSVCDSYGNEKYPILGVDLKCFCKCAGNTPWAKEVRGCLACAHAHGVGVEEAHAVCYVEASLKYPAPTITIAACYIGCGGKIPYPPILP